MQASVRDGMARRAAHLMETEELAARIAAGDPSVRSIDLRGYVRTQTAEDGSQSAAYTGAPEEYAQGHIPGAVFLDWTRDIVDESDPIPAQAATAEQLRRVLSERGLGDEHLLVAYDQHPASQFATRFWWLLRYYGHSNVRVLNGGWAKWTREGRPTTTEQPRYVPTVFTPRPQPEWRATADQVLGWLNDPAYTLIDARDEGQYTGRIRRGKHGGHIPGARHLPREAFFTADGVFRAPEELQAVANAAGAAPDAHIVAYCNGGVAATSVLFALSMLGYPHLTNYDGSWNEWGQRDDVPIA
ncbi:MAG TPA: sulfurtransferase [Chthonomonadaceae bacterium]|nr:sulfurtransferase [Chthonomonadaceae bacterium]